MKVERKIEKYIEGSQKPVEVDAFTGKGGLRHGN